jgi:dihydropteroate synthase
LPVSPPQGFFYLDALFILPRFTNRKVNEERMRIRSYFLPLSDIYQAQEELKRIGADPMGIEIMAPKFIHLPLKLIDLDLRAANILKQEILSLGGEAAVSRAAFELKEGKSDVLLSGTLRQYQLLIEKLSYQSFGLPRVGEKIASMIANLGEKDSLFRAKGREFTFGSRTVVMGAVNLTPDSFAGDGIHRDPRKAVDRALMMLDSGAEMIDIGGESSRPGAELVSVSEELSRVLPVITDLRKRTDALLSIDTYKPEVAREALAAGVDIVNDVGGGYRGEELLPLVREYEAGLIIMHMPNPPEKRHERPKYRHLIADIIYFFEDKLEEAKEAGVTPEQVIIDPGIGFAKNVDDNYLIIKMLKAFRALGRPVLVGPSRKSFIGKVLDIPPEERLEGTAAAVAAVVINGGDIIRVHDPAVMREVSTIVEKIKEAGK